MQVVPAAMRGLALFCLTFLAAVGWAAFPSRDREPSVTPTVQAPDGRARMDEGAVELPSTQASERSTSSSEAPPGDVLPLQRTTTVAAVASLDGGLGAVAAARLSAARFGPHGRKMSLRDIFFDDFASDLRLCLRVPRDEPWLSEALRQLWKDPHVQTLYGEALHVAERMTVTQVQVAEDEFEDVPNVVAWERHGPVYGDLLAAIAVRSSDSRVSEGAHLMKDWWRDEMASLLGTD